MFEGFLEAAVDLHVGHGLDQVRSYFVSSCRVLAEVNLNTPCLMKDDW